MHTVNVWSLCLKNPHFDFANRDRILIAVWNTGSVVFHRAAQRNPTIARRPEPDLEAALTQASAATNRYMESTMRFQLEVSTFPLTVPRAPGTNPLGIWRRFHETVTAEPKRYLVTT